MVKTSIEKLSEDIGFDIGASDDVTQANLLNGFCRAISSGIDNHKLDLQLCYIADKLTPKTKEVLIELSKFLEE